MSERPLAVIPAWRWWTGVFVVLAVAGFLTLLAYREGLPEIFDAFPQSDKVVHFASAGMLAFFLDGALKRRTLFVIARFAVPLAAIAVLLPAGIEEFLQRYSVHRTSSFFDFAADVAGVTLLLPLSRRCAK
jgi:VanZ family protein